jgi:hypothetical protein
LEVARHVRSENDRDDELAEAGVACLVNRRIATGEEIASLAKQNVSERSGRVVVLVRRRVVEGQRPRVRCE